MLQETIALHESTAWTKQAMATWSGRAYADLRISRKLSSPPFPAAREMLRQRLNAVFAANSPGFREIPRARWEAAVTAKTTIGAVRDLCHAQR